MSPAPSEYDPAAIETESDQFWKARGLLPKSGVAGPSDGPVLHLFEGAFVAREGPSLVAQRAVAADVDSRYLALTGRRAVGSLRWDYSEGPEDERGAGPVLRRLAVWTGGTGDAPWDVDPRRDGVERIVGRLARKGVIVSRDLPLRICPSCVAPRSPERILYQEEEGETYLVRFELALDSGNVSALVWIDAPWRLLGTSALLVHPELPYVVARYRRKGAEERVLTSRSSLERFRAWLSDATFEVLEEHPGRDFAGRAYVYPLRHEFPMGGGLAPPAGTILAISDVTDTGTGIVPLVPGHGSVDAVIAETHGITGWPLVTPRGQLDFTLVHKYAGLDLRTASEFIVRDLTEGGAVFAALRVRRGVPHCMLCGTSLIWVPGRAWCLEPGRLPSEAIELYRRLLPGAPPLARVEVAPWPVSETATSDLPDAVALLECSRCERLDALEGAPGCRCGGKMYPVRRRLVPSAASAFAAWARYDPFPAADSARIYLGERRRIPSLVHHLAGLSGVQGGVTQVGLTVLPTLPDLDLAKLISSHGADAVRAALVRSESAEGAAASFSERCNQERRRLARFRALAAEVLSACDAAMLTAFAQPIASFAAELEVEDRAILARWERTRVLAIADYDRWAAADVHQRVFRFVETDLALYRQYVRVRLALPGTPTSKRSVLRTLSHILRTVAVLEAPILPYLAEWVHRRFTSDRTSVFEGSLGGSDRAPEDDGLVAAWDRWHEFVGAVEEFRRSNGIPTQAPLPGAVLVFTSDDDADRTRADRPVLERLARVGRLEVASPGEPWSGRQRRMRPVESEIQRAYPAQASQIVHLLRRMPPRRIAEGNTAELSVVIQGLSRRLLPSMVEYVETLPENVVPVPWTRGELYLERPSGRGESRPAPPPLSPDAFWLVRRLERRLRHAPSPAPGSRRIAIVSAIDPMAAELRATAEPIAKFLGLDEFQVPESNPGPVPSDRITGRTHTGTRWSVHVPGLPSVPRRSKRRVAGAPGRRIRPAVENDGRGGAEEDYANEQYIRHEEEVRALNRELDGLLGSPALGPTKLRGAWELGYSSLDRIRGASYEELAAIPGFGRAIASAVVARLGGTVPPPVHRIRSHETDSRAVAPARTAQPRTRRPAEPTRRSDSIGVAQEQSLAESAREVRPEPMTPETAEAAPPAIPAAPPPNSSGALESRSESSTTSEPGVVPAPAEVPQTGSEERVSAPAVAARDLEGPEPSLGIGNEAAASAASNLGSAAAPEPYEAESPAVGDAAGPSPTEELSPVESTVSTVESEPPLSPEEVPSVDTSETGTSATPPTREIYGTDGAGALPIEAPPEPGPTEVPREEATGGPATTPEPPQGGIELIHAASVVTSLQPFLEATAAGHRGICLVRESPERIAAHVGSRPVEIYWLTNLGRGRTLRPNDLPGITRFLVDKLEHDQVTVFYIEGVEYLARIHGVEEVLGAFSEFDRRAKEYEARVWLHVTPALLNPDDLARIDASFPSGPRPA
jgi:hypothetical protein